MTLVFVYGTLKKGQPNHHRLCDAANGHAHFLASARTLARYPLVIAGDNNIPFLLNLPGGGGGEEEKEKEKEEEGEGEGGGGGCRVRGEVYRVDERMLVFLDAFECVPAMYQRTAVWVEVERWAEEGAEQEGGGGAANEDAPPPGGERLEAHVYSTTTFEAAWRALPTHESYDAYGDHGLVYVDRESRR